MRNKWLTRRAILLHVCAVVAVAICLALGWWQFTRAYYDHNTLSWGYTFEWPFFAVYAGWMWWKLLNEEPGFKNHETSKRDVIHGYSEALGDPTAEDREDESELEAYNAYLERLEADRHRTKR